MMRCRQHRDFDLEKVVQKEVNDRVQLGALYQFFHEKWFSLALFSRSRNPVALKSASRVYYHTQVRTLYPPWSSQRFFIISSTIFFSLYISFLSTAITTTSNAFNFATATTTIFNSAGTCKVLVSCMWAYVS